METLLTAIFWILLGLIVYVYAGYPALLFLLSLVVPAGRRGAEVFFPSVTVIIPAYNEEKHIGKKLENTLALEYPREKLEVVVMSDQSTDSTDEIVRGFAERGVRLFAQKERMGKAKGIWRVVGDTTGEIVLITDANTFLRPDALGFVVQPFADPRMGVTSGVIHLRPKSERSIGGMERIYWMYDHQIRFMESRLLEISFVHGGFYACRREIYPEVPLELQDDAVVPCHALTMGYRTTFVPDAVAVEEPPDTPEGIYRMKVRIAVRGIRTLLAFPNLMNPLKRPRAAISIWSHKFFRWSVPYFLIGILAANAALAGKPFYRHFLFFQLACYGMAAAGAVLDRFKVSVFVFRIPFFFCLVNASAMVAIWRALVMREKTHLWKPERN